MPKLGHTKIVKGNAIAYLLDIYRNDPEFVKEYDLIRRPHLEAIYQFTLAMIDFWGKCKEILSDKEYIDVKNAFFNQTYHTLTLPTKLDRLKSKMEKSSSKLEQYMADLAKLALKWKLRSSWATNILLTYDMLDFYTVLGMNSNNEIPYELLGDIYPWPQPLPDLVIKIPAWSFFLSSRKEIEKEISNKLTSYEQQLKSEGYHEFPSSLKRHARWWYSHYVNNKRYTEIAGMETMIPGGIPTVYERHVGEAVRRFSKLIGINSKDLR